MSQARRPPRIISPRARTPTAQARFRRDCLRIYPHKCAICGKTEEQIKKFDPSGYQFLVADHYPVPLSMGGSNNAEKNGRLLCAMPCNLLEGHVARFSRIRGRLGVPRL